jgi:hypothetical protein
MKRSLRVPARSAWIAIGIAAGLAVVAAPPGADAQRADRARAEYTMVAGRVQGATEQILYLLDGANQEVAAVRWDRGNDQLTPIGYQDLRADAARGEGAGR